MVVVGFLVAVRPCNGCGGIEVCSLCCVSQALYGLPVHTMVLHRMLALLQGPAVHSELWCGY